MAATKKNEGRNATLEAKLIADPDDEATYLVYADWLQTKGDPRGELIMLHHAGKTKEANALIKKHSEHFLGPLVNYTKPFDGSKRQVFEWHLGFIRSARFALDTNSTQDVLEQHVKERARKKNAASVPVPAEEEISIENALKTLLRHPSGAFLRELNIAMNMLDEGCFFQPVCEAIAKIGAPSVRRLRLGEYRHAGPRSPTTTDYDYENSWTSFGSMHGLWKALPRLEQFVLQGSLSASMRRGSRLGKIVAPKLTHVELMSGGMDRSNTAAVAKATWRELRYLDIWFGAKDYGFSGGIRDIAPILAGVGLPKLEHLGLMNAEFTDEICEALPKAKILPRLGELSLALGTMSDRGAEVLAKNKAAFKHLRVLDLEHNFLSSKGIALVKGLCREVKISEQGKPEDDIYEETGGRYVSVSE